VGEWRIDELAQRAGMAVDTIRYYQRERLLPPAERSGRTKRYGEEHLERLVRIRELQSRRFSLAAIRALLDSERPGFLEQLFADADGMSYALDELVEAAGLSPAMTEGLRRVGMLRDPGDYGRTAYDGDDLELLRAFADLGRIGVPDEVVLEMARIYADGLDRVQREVLELFQGKRGPAWSAEARDRFRSLAAERSPRIARDARVVADYTHQRNLQRLAFGALEHAHDADA
jgi:DNA-binding transcriptional MerR regulator